VLYDGVAVGSIAEMRDHVSRLVQRQGGIDTMPLMDLTSGAAQRSGADAG
jgi:hypothetical protein